jgi:hypothetical protein
MKICRYENCDCDTPVLDGLCVVHYRETYNVTVLNALAMHEQGMLMPHEVES